MDEKKNEIILFENQGVKLEVNLKDETVWLSQQQMADLYDTTKQNISLHIKNIFDEEELDINSTVKEFLTVQKEGNRKVERKFKHNFWRTIRIGEKNKKNKLNHTLCIVTRYFGGIKLGAGGLVRAYSNSISNALKNSKFFKLKDGYKIILFDEATSALDNENQAKIKKAIDNLVKDYEITKKEYGKVITYELLITNDFLNKLNKSNIKYEIINKEIIKEEI